MENFTFLASGSNRLITLKSFRSYGTEVCNLKLDSNDVQSNTNEGKNLFDKWAAAFNGILLASLSGALYGFTSVVVKIEEGVYAVEITLVRFMIIALFSLPMAIMSGREFTRGFKTYPLVVFCGVTCTLSALFRYEAYQRLPLAEANLIVFSSPVLVSLLGIFILKEKITVNLWISLILSTLGILFITRVPELISQRISNISITTTTTSSAHTTGIVYAFLSLLLHVLYCLSVAKLKEYHYSVLTFHTGWVGVLISAVHLYLSGRATIPDPAKHQQLFMMLLSFMSFLAIVFQTVAMKFESAGLVVLCRAIMDVLVSFVFQIYFFKDLVDLYLIVGAVLIVTSGFTLLVGKYIAFMVAKNRGFEITK